MDTNQTPTPVLTKQYCVACGIIIQPSPIKPLCEDCLTRITNAINSGINLSHLQNKK